MIVGPQLSEDLGPGGLRVEPQLYGFLVGNQADLRLDGVKRVQQLCGSMRM